jgi:RNA polymerase sigma-70 factor (ECF subfamily)
MSKPFQDLITAHLPQLRTYALSLTRDRPDADDLLQSTVELMLKYEGHFTAGSNFRAWAYRILKNRFISDCRSKARRPVSLTPYLEMPVPPASMTCVAEQEGHVFNREVACALDKLSPALRQVLTLFCYAELPYVDVARIMRCSIGTVKSRLWRARRQLNTLLLAAAPRKVGNPALAKFAPVEMAAA